MPTGELRGSGRLRWSPSWQASADLRLAGFDPGYFVPDFPGALNGAIVLQAEQAAGGDWRGHARVSALRGQLRKRPIQGEAQLDWAAGVGNGQVATAARRQPDRRQRTVRRPTRPASAVRTARAGRPVARCRRPAPRVGCRCAAPARRRRWKPTWSGRGCAGASTTPTGSNCRAACPPRAPAASLPLGRRACICPVRTSTAPAST